MNEPDFRTEPFMTYWFQGFKFEFIMEDVHVTTPQGDVYKIQFDRFTRECPFVITLLERG